MSDSKIGHVNITLGEADELFVRHDGKSDIINDLNMFNHSLTDLPTTPATLSNVVTKEYVDKGGILEGTSNNTVAHNKDLDLNNHKVFNVKNPPVSGDDLVSKEYLENNYIPYSNSKMKHDLDTKKYRITVSEKPTNDKDGVNKKWVDETLLLKHNAIHNGSINFRNQARFINVGHPVGLQDAATKKTVDDQADLYFQNKGTLTGVLNMNNNKLMNLVEPRSSSDAVTKSYVQTVYNNHKGSPTFQDLNINSHKLIGVAAPSRNDHAVNKKFIYDNTIMKDNPNLPFHINMNNNTVRSTSNVQYSEDSMLNKKMVDDHLLNNTTILTNNTTAAVHNPLDMDGHMIHDLNDPVNPTDGMNMKTAKTYFASTNTNFLTEEDARVAFVVNPYSVIRQAHLKTQLINTGTLTDPMTLSTTSVIPMRYDFDSRKYYLEIGSSKFDAQTLNKLGSMIGTSNKFTVVCAARVVGGKDVFKFTNKIELHSTKGFAIYSNEIHSVILQSGTTQNDNLCLWTLVCNGTTATIYYSTDGLINSNHNRTTTLNDVHKPNPNSSSVFTFGPRVDLYSLLVYDEALNNNTLKNLFHYFQENYNITA